MGASATAQGLLQWAEHFERLAFTLREGKEALLVPAPLPRPVAARDVVVGKARGEEYSYVEL